MQWLRYIYTGMEKSSCWGNCSHWFHQKLSICPLQWRHDECDGVSNHQPHDILLNCLFRRRWQKTSKLRVTGQYVGNSLVTGERPHKGPVTRKMLPFDDVTMANFYAASDNNDHKLIAFPVQFYCIKTSGSNSVWSDRLTTRLPAYVFYQETNRANSTMHVSHILQCIIRNRNVYISVLNDALWLWINMQLR